MIGGRGGGKEGRVLQGTVLIDLLIFLNTVLSLNARSAASCH